MRHFLVIGLLILGLNSIGLAAETPAAPPDTLILKDLVNRPDRWPTTVNIPHDFHFSNGAVVQAGDKARVAHFDGSLVLLISSNNVRFAAKPDDVGLLDAANQAWSALTPAQRAIDPESLAADQSLWPVQVKVIVDINSSFGKMRAGTAVSVIAVTPKGPKLGWPNTPNQITVPFDTTDIFETARNLALIDPSKRPSRIAAALENIMVDADGKPFHDDHLQDKQIFALYIGAGWCPPCRAFSPDFVAFLNDAMPKHPELAAVFLSEDRQLGDMYAYMKDEKMPNPAVTPDEFKRSALLLSYAAEIIPELVIVDRSGKILACNDDFHGNRADLKDTIAQLGQLLATPATQP
jgi:thiol-disulfide isomerase/thioredoxin